MKHRTVTKAIISSLVSIVICLGGIVHADTLRIGGTGVALGGMAILGEAFEDQHPGTTIEVLPSLGSSGGVKALLAGAIDLSVSSRALKDAETVQGATARLYATTPLAIVTSSDTGTDTITTEELADMYVGNTLVWPSGEQIRVVLRPVSETDTELLRGLSDTMARAVDAALKRPGLVTATNDQDNAGTLERLPGSLGLVALGQIATEGRQLKVLAYDGVFPYAGGIGSADIGFTKSLYLVATDSISPLASEFMTFVFSPEGQAILEAFDHSPAR